MTDRLAQNSTDYVVAAAKAVLGMVPFAGSLLAELAGTIIPKQRLDRLSHFASELEKRIGSLDQEAVRAKLTDENFTDLLEETARHAARAVTEERRAYLASLLAAGVSEERVSFIESKHLLRMLGEINDIEIIWLRFYLYPYMNGDEEFRAKHASVLEPVGAHLGSDQATLDRQALRENYLQHLVSLGVLEHPLYVDSKTSLPVFDKMSKDWRRQGHRVTPLGRLLRRHIGLGTAENEA
jgi:hypothetical protein